MHKLILPLFIAIAFSPAALAETKTCQDNFVPSMGRASGGFVVGDCTLYKTARGARAMFRQVSSVCKENEACAMTVDAAKYCEAGFCEWKIRKVLSVAAVAAGQPNASAGQPEGAEDQSKPDATQSKTGAAQPNSDCQTTLVVYGINLRARHILQSRLARPSRFKGDTGNGSVLRKAA